MANEIEAPLQFKSRIETMIAEYKPNKNVVTLVETRIVLNDDIPVSRNPRRLAPKEKRILDEQICEWLRSGIIKPNRSECASSVVIVRKKDRTSSIRIDYQSLNKKVICDKFPMPLIGDKIDAYKFYKVF